MAEMNTDGDSPIYAGFGYIGIILKQIDMVNLASDEAYANRSLYCLKWLNSLRQLYPLVKSQMDRKTAKDEIDFEEIYFDKKDNSLKTRIVKINKGDKYTRWFKEIEEMIERNGRVKSMPGLGFYDQITYRNDKKILSALSNCYTDLLFDANAKHLLMPEGRPDMKDLVKREWIDRAKKKVF